MVLDADALVQASRSRAQLSNLQGPIQAGSARRAARGILAAWLTLLSMAPALAEKPAIELRYGQDGGDYDSRGAAFRFAPVWSRDMDGWKAFIHPMVEVNHFRYTGSAGGRGSINELGGLGLFRIGRGDGWAKPYGELGLGLSLFSQDDLGGKQFSTRYQFSEHIGLGLEFKDTWMIGWRFSHYSNATIKLPNDGMSLNQIVVGVQF